MSNKASAELNPGLHQNSGGANRNSPSPQPSSYKSGSVATVPPGFFGDTLRASSLSAPPPGFHDESEQHQRDQTAAMLLQQHHLYYQQTSQHFLSQRDAEIAHRESLEDSLDGGRSKSYANLAAALGESMAQSMDDSFLERSSGVQRQVLSHQGRTISALGGPSSSIYGASSMYPGEAQQQQQQHQMLSTHHELATRRSNGVDNYQRQSRHTAARRIGQSSGSTTVSKPHQHNVTTNTHTATSVMTPSTIGSHNTQSSIYANTSNGANGDDTGADGMAILNASLARRATAATSPGGSNHLLVPASISSGAGRYSIEDPRVSANSDLFQGSAGTNRAPGLVRNGSGSLFPSSDDTALAMDRMAIGEHIQKGRSSAPPELELFTYQQQMQQPVHSVKHPGEVVTVTHNCNPPNIDLNLSTPTTTGGAVGVIPPSRGAGAVMRSLTPLSRSGTPELQHATPSNSFMGTDDLSRTTEQELSPFLRETMQQPSPQFNALNSSSKPQMKQVPSSHPSRGLAVLACGSGISNLLNTSDIRFTCESFGTLESFRSEFWQSRGVIFVSFFDLRGAQRAASELPNCLLRSHNCSNDPAAAASYIKVKYSVPLHCRSATDESMIVLSDLPNDMDELSLNREMESFGGVRSVHYQMVPGVAGSQLEGGESLSYTVEFYDIQDAKHALLELQSAEPWGPNVEVEVGMRNPTKRRQAKDLLRLIGRWRHGSTHGSSDNLSHASNGSVKVDSAISLRVSSSPPPLASSSISTSQNANESISSSGHKKNTSRQGSKNSTPLCVSPLAGTPSTSPMPQIEAETVVTQSLAQNVDSINPNVTQPGQYVTAPSVSAHDFRHTQQSVPAQHTQLVLGPDGQYSYVVVNSHPGVQPGAVSSHYPGVHSPYVTPSLHHEQQLHYWPPAHPHHPHPHAVHHPHPSLQHHVAGLGHVPAPTQLVMPNYIDMRTGYPVYVPVGLGAPSNNESGSTVSSGSSGQSGPQHVAANYNTQDWKNRGRNSMSRASKGKHGAHNGNMSGGSTSQRQGGRGCDDASMALDIKSVKNGIDCRTSLMVRNIPNKYTQRMLLDEFSVAGHGSDKIDFFYLPIDFKNKCNRGYAFVNFVDYRDIVAFHNQYNGNPWKVFNSDKICDITYARIQGKSAMLKRFEHSALLDKDDEYRPLVFASQGPNKGERESFPSASHSGVPPS